MITKLYTGTFKKTVSVVIPTYNCKNILAKTLDGLKMQTYPASLMEIIIANDGSSDGLENFIKEYSAPWKLIMISQDNKGFRIASVRNKAIKAAHGEIILSLDADMFPMPEFVSEHMKIFHVIDNVAGIGPRRYVDMSHILTPLNELSLNKIRQLPDIRSSSIGFYP